MVHLSNHHYTVVAAGSLECVSGGDSHVFLSLEVGQVVDLSAYVTCHNERLVLGGGGISVQQYVIETKSDNIDALLLNRDYSKGNNSLLELQRKKHRLMEGRLKGELASNKMDLDALSAVTLEAAKREEAWSFTNVLWLIVLSLFLFLACLLVSFRAYRMIVRVSRKSSTLDNPSPPAHPHPPDEVSSSSC